MTQFVFITGAGRCGTTLTRSLLDGHSRLNVLPDEYTNALGRFLNETGYSLHIDLDYSVQFLIDEFIALFDGLPEQEDVRRSLHNRIAESKSSGQNVLRFDAFLKILCDLDFNGQKSTTVIDIAHENISGLLDAVPNAKVIHLVRNPLTQMNSMYRFRFRDANSFGGGFPGSWLFGEAWIMVYRAFREANHHRDNDRVHIVRLEDLQEDPKGTIDGMLAFLYLKSEPVNQRITRLGRQHDANSTYGKATSVIDQEEDISCLTPNDLYHCGQMRIAEPWYEIRQSPYTKNGFGVFLWRQLGFVGKHRVCAKTPFRIAKVCLVAIAQYIQDRRHKHEFECRLEIDSAYLEKTVGNPLGGKIS